MLVESESTFETNISSITHFIQSININNPHLTAQNSSETFKNIEFTMAKLNMNKSAADADDDEKRGKSIGERIMRPRSNSITKTTRDPLKRRNNSTENSKEQLNPNKVKKLYMNQTLGRPKNTPLETIFELKEEDEMEKQMVEVSCLEESSTDDSLIFGKRKIKRSITFSDVKVKPTKTTREKRKQRIHRLLGKQKRFNRISMDAFLKYWNAEDLVTITKPESIEKKSSLDS